MEPGCYLLFPDYKPIRLVAVTRITSTEVEYEWLDQGCRKRGILTKYSPESSVNLGEHEGRRVFGIINEATSLQKLQSAFAEFVKELNAKKEAARTLEREREAKEQAKKEAERAVALERRAREEDELKRQREEQAKLDQIEAAERARLRRLQNQFEELDRKFFEDFVGAYTYWREHLVYFINESEFKERRNAFVGKWFAKYPDLALDQEQASAITDCETHIQVTARAGSGKTRTLVARALFQIQHCRIPASSILILAFNKKAVEEIRERLLKYLTEEQMPHVLTFHALAYRIVRPQEDLIYDEGETEEGQVFSATMQRIIDTELRGGALEGEFRALMEVQWASDLSRILEQGFHLPKEQFLEFRARMPRLTIDGRRVKSEADKQVGNVLYRHRVSRYSYQRSLHRHSGESYVPDFSHTNKETERRFVIEILRADSAFHNPAREAFWKSERASNSVLIQIPESSCRDGEETSRYLVEALGGSSLLLAPMSDDELWDAVKDRAIDNFTKAVKGFISRCQKELITPERLAELVDQKSEFSEGIQEMFWRLSGKIFSRYLAVLSEEKKTDFDQLMLNAAAKLRDGSTHFTSSRGEGNVTRIRHVLIDEFQDFSHLFNELRKAFIALSPEALFFCVGDDWQAINKFAGSDLRYFTGFQDTFQPSVRKLITRNYRSCRRIVETGNQVMAGHGEPSIPNSTGNGHVLLVGSDGELTYSEAEEIVVEELGEQAVPILRIVSASASKGYDVAILSRTGTIATPEGMLRLEIWKKRLREYLPEDHRKHLKVSTTHGYKGKESETVILLAPECYPLVHPDAIFSTIFGDTIDTLRTDEQRLFYVGVTRARSRLCLLPEVLPLARQFPNMSFLPSSTGTWFNVDQLSARLLCGGKVIVRLSNRPGCPTNSGTYPLHQKLKAKFKWDSTTKIWSRILEVGSINSTFECIQFLQRQTWLKEADGVIAHFAWLDQQHRMKIVAGKVMPDTVQDQLEDADRYAEAQQNPETDYDVEDYSLSDHQPTDFIPDIGPPQPVAVAMGVFETSVVGMHVDGRKEKARHLAVGHFVRLEREPGNAYDRNAIKVMTAEGMQIGYLSRHVAAHLASGLDAWGGTSQAKVTSVWKQPPPHFLVSIQICFPLPPGVVIPQELDARTHLEDSPFDSPKPKPREQKSPEVTPAAPIPTSEAMPTEPEPGPLCASTPDSLLPDYKVPSNFEGLSQSQRDDLENLLEPRLGPIIAEMYLAGCSDWPEIGYEGRDIDGRCTGSMLEVAWLDFKIGIAVPTNEFISFAEAGWAIIPAATVTASELRSQFTARTEPTTPTEAIPSAPSSKTGSVPSEGPSTREFTDTNVHIRHGQFYDEQPDDDIPF